MLSACVALAMRSPGRQLGFRRAVVAHVLFLAAGATWTARQGGPALLGYLLLTAGIVEGAALLGWRLTQLPKSQALEFLLATPLRPRWVLLSEALVGLARLGLVTLAGLPILVLLVVTGRIAWIDLGPLLGMPFTWGAVTGLGLVAWAYEPLPVRRWGERVILGCTLFYLVVGVLAGEHLEAWIRFLPDGLGLLVLNGFEAFHRYNPFAVIRFWAKGDLVPAQERMLAVEAAAVALVVVLLLRTASRLQGHFHERHYQPRHDRRRDRRGVPAEHPLAWWAVRRVTEYSGRVNLWLAGGFGTLYALYTVAGPRWPAWLGRNVFAIFDQAGGLPVWGTALVVLAAVPAAFQYGLWDSNRQDRCRRLELLLLTGLSGADYWRAAASAAWRRGRGYFLVAGLLWAAGALAGTLTPYQAAAALASGVIVWGLYFTLGFRAFTRGGEANLLGLALTLGLPGLVFVLYQVGGPALAAAVPPGGVYYATGQDPALIWVGATVLAGGFTLAVARRAREACATQLRDWYDRNHRRILIAE
jgi:hypothetical protein